MSEERYISPFEQPAESACEPAPDVEALRAAIIQALHKIYDPEIPVDIYELGLIYEISITPPGIVNILMTLTSPMCPVAESMPGMVESLVGKVPGVDCVRVNLAFDPPWDMSRMSEAAKLELGL